MNWEKKTEMIRLGNVGVTDEFKRFIYENIEDFDDQSWDMFVGIVSLTPENIKENEDFFKKIYPHVKEMKLMNIREGIRLETLKLLTEDYLM